jgi:hypothetical protein
MTMLPRIEAQRQLETIQAMSLGFGGGSRHERQRALATLERQATGNARNAPASPQMLAAIGVKVVVLPAPEAQSNG